MYDRISAKGALGEAEQAERQIVRETIHEQLPAAVGGSMSRP
jgi:hypothetical protein